MVSGWGILNFTGRVKSGAFCPSVKAIAASFLEEFLLPEALSIKTGVLYCKRNPQDKNGQRDRAYRQSPLRPSLSLSPCTYCFIALKMRDVILSRSGAKEKNLALQAAR